MHHVHSDVDLITSAKASRFRSVSFFESFTPAQLPSRSSPARFSGTVTAAVAGTLTAALGYAICELAHLYAYKVLVEHESLSAVDWFDPKQVERLMRDYIARRKNSKT